MTITEFLLARIAEDEAMAREATDHRLSLASQPGLGLHLSADGPAGERWTHRYDTVNATHEDGRRAGGIAYVGNFGMDLVKHIARHDPARVLAECEAKLRIVERHDSDGWDFACEVEGGGRPDPGECPDLRALAAVDASHPDYDEGWKV